MPIGVFVEARPASDLLHLAFDHCRDVVAEEKATAGAVIVYQVANVNRISLHLSLQLEMHAGSALKPS
jgi:hypothetical protein